MGEVLYEWISDSKERLEGTGLSLCLLFHQVRTQFKAPFWKQTLGPQTPNLLAPGTWTPQPPKLILYQVLSVRDFVTAAQMD